MKKKKLVGTAPGQGFSQGFCDIAKVAIVQKII
jgi:hypothetical protein